MLLSEAILLSIGIVKNDRTVFLYIPSGCPPCGCAVGTALYSIGHTGQSLYGLEAPYKNDAMNALYEAWPWTRQIGDTGITIGSTISHRHFYGESRESIAAWVAEKERELGIVDDTTKEEQVSSVVGEVVHG